MGDKPKFSERLQQLWAPVLVLAGCFAAGMTFQWKIDDSRISELKDQIEFWFKRGQEAQKLDSLFALLDYSQMSPTAEYKLLYGDGSIGERPSQISLELYNTITAIESGKIDSAIDYLTIATHKSEGTPFLEYYWGIAKSFNDTKRAAPHFERAHFQFTTLLRIKPNNAPMRLCDAIVLTFLGHGDSATSQLHRALQFDPQWRQIACTRMLLKYDTSALSRDEKVLWSEFEQGLKKIRCDTTILLRGSKVIDVASNPPELKWPPGYDKALK